MSFILDALRKSDQMRQGQTLPSLSALPIDTPPRRTLPAWLVVLTGLLLLALGLLIGWWQPWTPQNASPTTAPAPLSDTLSMAAPPMVPPAGTGTGVHLHPNALKKAAQPSSRPATVIPARPLTNTPPPPRPEPEPEQKLERASKTNPPPTPAEAPPVIEYDHLPAAIQAELPNLSVTAHAHSKNPKTSYVFIKDRMLHEGDTLPPGLTLEKITAKGMIFSYKGQRFHRGLHP